MDQTASQERILERIREQIIDVTLSQSAEALKLVRTEKIVDVVRTFRAIKYSEKFMPQIEEEVVEAHPRTRREAGFGFPYAAD